MTISTTAILGILFVVLSIVATYLMFHFWGYPYDKEARKSECPQWKMNIHRVVGYAYAIVYVVIMIEMFPRLWEYQVEFPPRTVAHILLGVSIGVILVVKISIIRFFRHLEEWMPALGVALMVMSILLGVLSFAGIARERTLAAGAVGGSAFSQENVARVARLLPKAGFPDDVDVAALSTVESLHEGRRILMNKCVECHDLKTVISKPRTPQDWVRTSQRMTLKPTLSTPLEDSEAFVAAAYLIAITPSLHASAQEKRKDLLERKKSQEAVDEGLAAEKQSDFDAGAAKELYEDECTLCHELDVVDDAPPTTVSDVDGIMQRMIDNGLDLERDEIETIRHYMIHEHIGEEAYEPAPDPENDEGDAADAG